MTTTHRGLPVSHLTGFVGRDDELDSLRGLVSSRRLVTIIGQAGVGKSRLAVRVADVLRRSIGGSIVLADMADTASDDLEESLARAVGAEGSTVSAIAQTLGDRPHLLVVDNLDDATASARILEELLSSTAETRILVTARERIGIAGETPYALMPLDLPSAATYRRTADKELESASFALLVQRILDADPAFDAAIAPLDDLVAVCRSTDGLPRFIEAAARAVSALGAHEAAIAVTEDATVLDEFLPPGSGARTSRAIAELSLKRLSPPAAELLRRLALLESGADLRFAAEVFADDQLSRIAAPAVELVDRSLVRSETVGGVRRLRVPLHYRRHLRESWDVSDRDREEAMLHRALLRRLRQCAAAWFSEDQLTNIQFLNRHAAAITSLLGAMTSNADDAHEALEVISALRYYWQLHPVDPWPRVRDWLGTALSLDTAKDAVTLRAMLTDAYIAFHEGDLDGARSQLNAIQNDFESDLADFDEQIFAVFVGALVSLADGDLVVAERDLTRVLRESLDADVREHLGEKYWHLAACQIAAGKQGDALATLADGLAYCDRAGDIWGRAYMWCLLALVADRQGVPDEAMQHVQQSVEVMADFGDRVGLALCVQLLTAFSAQLGDEQSVAQLAALVPPSSLTRSRPPVPLPELSTRTLRFGPPAALADDLSLGDALRRIVDGEDASSESVRVETSGVLSARESEVAALIAEGLSNPAIAARLVLSRRTVEGHVQRILAKLGFRSRSQIAVWDAQHSAAGTSVKG
ncbi:LuxR C-terminal-related transcriptional regulator [Microbacterium tenebrionis]|nr:LuxR C-terminal-related transcriptional regulator [Microbacterium tenebrionis]